MLILGITHVRSIVEIALLTGNITTVLCLGAGDVLDGVVEDAGGDGSASKEEDGRELHFGLIEKTSIDKRLLVIVV